MWIIHQMTRVQVLHTTYCCLLFSFFSYLLLQVIRVLSCILSEDNNLTLGQGPKLRLPGRQCDQKFSSGDQNFIVGRQLVTRKAGCHFRLSRSEKMIKN